MPNAFCPRPDPLLLRFHAAFASSALTLFAHFVQQAPDLDACRLRPCRAFRRRFRFANPAFFLSPAMLSDTLFHHMGGTYFLSFLRYFFFLSPVTIIS